MSRSYLSCSVHTDFVTSLLDFKELVVHLLDPASEDLHDGEDLVGVLRHVVVHLACSDLVNLDIGVCYDRGVTGEVLDYCHLTEILSCLKGSDLNLVVFLVVLINLCSTLQKLEESIALVALFDDDLAGADSLDCAHVCSPFLTKIYRI